MELCTPLIYFKTAKMQGNVLINTIYQGLHILGCTIKYIEAIDIYLVSFYNGFQALGVTDWSRGC